MEDQEDITKRIDRLERNYIILLKRVLEIDGVQFVSKHAAFTSKVMTTRDELSKGLNEPEPTIHWHNNTARGRAHSIAPHFRLPATPL